MNKIWEKHKKKIIIIGVVLVLGVFAIIGTLVGPSDMDIVGNYYAVNQDTIIDSVLFEINDDGTWAITADGEISEEGTYTIVNIGTYKSIIHLVGIRYFLNGSTENIDQEIEIERTDVANEDYDLFIITNYNSFIEYHKQATE